MPPQFHWVYIALAAFFLLFGLAYRAPRRRLREGSLALSQGDFARARDALMALSSSLSPGAFLIRRLMPGQVELQVAAAYSGLGEPAAALEWCRRGLRRTRVISTQAALRKVACQSCAETGDLDGLREHASSLRQLAQRMSQPQSVFNAHAANCYGQAGLLAEAIEIADEAIRSSPPNSAAFFEIIISLLYSVGEFEAAFAIAEGLLQPNPASVSRPIDPHVTAIRDNLRQLSQATPVLAAVTAAELAGRQDLHAKYLSAISLGGGCWPIVRMMYLGQSACAAAWTGDRNTVESLIDQMDTLLRDYPDDKRLPAIRSRSIGRAWQVLGNHEQAIAHYQQALADFMPPVEQSLVHARLAESMIALGARSEAADHRERAQTLAPKARWNYRHHDVFDGHHVQEMAVRWIFTLQSRPPASSPVGDLDPVPPVASKTACWLWPLGVLSMVPFIGAAVGLILGPLSLWLMFRRQRLRHDRKVAMAGLAFAILSIAFLATPFAYRAHLRREYAKFVQAAPAAASQEAADPELMGADFNEEDFTPDTDTGAFAQPTDELDGEEEGSNASSDADVDEDSSDSVASKDENVASYAPLPGRAGEVLLLAVLILSVMLHEIGHALAAYWGGDPTARDRDRLSLNPIKHISLFGSIVVPAIMTATGSPVIGWAKPVPISPHRLRHPRRWNLAVSLAGVSANFLLAMLAANLIVVTCAVLYWLHPEAYLSGQLYHLNYAVRGLEDPAGWQLTVQLLAAIVLTNGVLAGFNLLPFPPLDGFNALRALMPNFLNRLAAKASGVGMIVFICLIAFDAITYLLLPGIVFAMVLLALVDGLVRGL